LNRKIIHIDMDAFYASVEQRDNPAYKGRPLAVGGNRERGVVAAASYEARAFGVRSAMSSRLAYRKCPHIIFVQPRFEVYKEVSMQIRKIFSQYTDLIEPLSLDEAYMDVTENKTGNPSATLIAQEIRHKIQTQTGLTASAGVSFNKFLAKVASDVNKPNGITVITPEKAEAFLDALEIDKFYGIGKVTAQRMHELGIHCGKDLKRYSKIDLLKLFGKSGGYYFDIVRAIDERPVNPNRIRKSIGAENTFEYDLKTLSAMQQALDKIAEKVFERMQRSRAYGKTLTLKVKFSDFEQITRSQTLRNPIQSLESLQQLARDILHEADLVNTEVRLLGLSISNIERPEPGKGIQLKLNFPGNRF
jgi:DNA polymerase IV